MRFINTLVTCAAAAAQLVSGHFSIVYPEWRADSISEENGYSQWIYPCANVGGGAGNRTDWPIHGGVVQLTLRHPWTYLYINVGLGEGNLTNFNMSLLPGLANVTGRGNFCVPTIPLPMEILDGTLGSIQVVTNGVDGADMYNCADITFRAAAKVPDGVCHNSSDISSVFLGESSGGPNATVTVQAPAPTSHPNSATEVIMGGMAMAGMVGLVGVLVGGMGM
ncbi:uncharacterized protein GGS25DRAFT_525512 [Hypoxylon fragiforme]|uniref:uncharacterized protein n=1 Tax=Hypoxylon fragiforme TaxID=63214 RepID=UPI0020C5E486|nr:uncharacterized protein GGS25DRAFT_525512 [Hypoxylon fragiforme]KAI2604233.1 hypothetical protein GGS25DRAFT_525512 [Hypoxylon fragiforme]